MVAYGLLGAAILAALAAWQGGAYVELGDGVYAYTAHAIRGSASLYRDIAAAQPPGIFWLGGAVFAVHDGIGALRGALGALLLVQGALVAHAVWRLTGGAVASAVAGLASLLTPWSLAEHTQLLPETVGAPVLLGGAILAARSRWSAAAGALGALAVAVKASFLLPALAVGAVCARRWAYAAGLAAAGAVLVVAFFALYGQAGWDNVVTAQRQSGHVSVSYIGQLWGQAAWNDLALVLVALGAWLLRDRVADRALLETLLALLLSVSLLLATLYKHGTYLQVIVPLEPPAVALAATTVVLLWRELRAGAAPPSVVAASAAVVAGLGLTAAQSASVLARPTSPALLEAPWSSIDLGARRTGAQTDADIRAARACPPGVPYSGAPYIAYRAGRRMPGDQPDQFIIVEPVHSAILRVAQADPRRCP